MKQVVIERAQGELDALVEQMISRFCLTKVEGPIVVKPNLLKPRDRLCVTSGEMILSVCKAARKIGGRLIVADSPAFGSARQVIKGMDGVMEALREMGVEVSGLGDPIKVRLPSGMTVGVSRLALDAALIINVPRLKAHCQMRVTCGVKNLYGTVVGFRKALYHVLHGGDLSRFSNMILDISSLFKNVITVADCIVAMHETGPSGGRPIHMGFIAASDSPVALDTAIYSIIGATPVNVPLWKAAQDRALEGSRLEDIAFVALGPDEIAEGREFVLPTHLTPLRFSPIRFVKGRVKSLLKRIKS